MLRADKKEFIQGLESIYTDSNSVIITHYHNLSVADITDLRVRLRNCGASFKVVKNTLAKIAAMNIEFAHDASMFSGPTAIAYAQDPVVAAKCVVEFIQTNDNLKIVGGIVNNIVLDTNTVYQLAKLPSMDTLRAQIIGVLQAPSSNLARVIQALPQSLAYVIKSYADNN